MAKKLVKKIKVQAKGGKATPAPPLGPVLGQAGINIGEFVNQFNEQTRDRMGEVVPIVISVFDDRTFTSKAGSITKAQIRAIAEEKMVDLTASTVEQAMKSIEGTARSMGVNVIE
jgi:large subunit ribosomal protein L11